MQLYYIYYAKHCYIISYMFLLYQLKVKMSVAITLSTIIVIKMCTISGAGMNLKVGRHRSRAKMGGHRSGAKRRRKKFFGRAPPLFGSKSTISRFGERFRDGQYSLVSFLSAVLLLMVPPPVLSHL